MDERNVRVKVFRYQGRNGSGGVGISENGGDRMGAHYDTFEFSAPPGMTVLSGLFHIQDHLDDSLAFRYSCRGAVCGSCAMLINKVPRLACRTQLDSLIHDHGKEGIDSANTNREIVTLKPYPAIKGGESWDPSTEVLIEPLPHFPILKDLIVDMERFFEFYRSIRPYFDPDNKRCEEGRGISAGDETEGAEGGTETSHQECKERLMDPEDVKELEHYTNCILCAACYGSCPVSGEAPGFIGPAALAKLYRFTIDPREEKQNFRLELANRKDGWWGCEFHTNCKRVCPKGVPPNLGIGKARQKLNRMGKQPGN